MHLLTLVGIGLIGLGTIFSTFGQYFLNLKAFKKVLSVIMIICAIILVSTGTYLSLLGQNYDNKKNYDNYVIKYNLLLNENSKLLDKNEDLLNRIDRYLSDIQEKDKRIDQLEKQIESDIYKSLAPELKNKIIDRLISLKNVIEYKYELKFEDIKFNFGFINRNINTSYIIRDLNNMLNESGYFTVKPSNATKVYPNLKIYDVPVLITNPCNEDFVQEITLYLREYITNLKYGVDSNQNKSIILFQFFGIPKFNEIGQVIYNEKVD